ncbi:MAG: hypothetical protein ACOYKA_05080 [Legionellaceae bacterium]
MIKYLKENIATIRQSMAYTAIMAAAAVVSYFVPEIVIPIVTLAIAVISLDFLFFNYLMQSQKKPPQDASQQGPEKSVSFDDGVSPEQELTSGARITASLIQTGELPIKSPTSELGSSPSVYSPTHTVRNGGEIDLMDSVESGAEDDEEKDMSGEEPSLAAPGSESLVDTDDALDDAALVRSPSR